MKKKLKIYYGGGGKIFWFFDFIGTHKSLCLVDENYKTINIIKLYSFRGLYNFFIKNPLCTEIYYSIKSFFSVLSGFAGWQEKNLKFIMENVK